MDDHQPKKRFPMVERRNVACPVTCLKIQNSCLPHLWIMMLKGRANTVNGTNRRQNSRRPNAGWIQKKKMKFNQFRNQTVKAEDKERVIV